MSKHDTEIASAAHRLLVEQIGRERFELWFGARVVLRVDGKRLIVAASPFLLDRLRKHFRQEIVETAARVLGATATISFDPCASEPAIEPAKDGSRDAVRVSPDQDKANAPTDRGEANGARRQRRKFARLESFVEGPGNRIALASVRRVLESPGAVNPLYLHGPPGCGKTHLLEGLWSVFRARRGVRRVVYSSAEQFTSQFLEALREGGLPGFRRKFRDAPIVMVDDVQFFVGKKATLVEVLHTFDDLMRAGSQIVFAADRPPAELNGLGADLAGRLAAGLTCGVEPPDFETRLGIVQSMAKQREMQAPPDVLKLIAARFDGDARQMAGALNRLEAASRAFTKKIDLAFAELTLADLFVSARRAVRLADIDEAVCDVFGIDTESLRSSAKSRGVSRPRMLAMWLARKYTRSAFTEISRHYHRKSHSTVISAEKKVSDWMAGGESVRLGYGECSVEEAVRRIEAKLRAV